MCPSVPLLYGRSWVILLAYFCLAGRPPHLMLEPGPGSRMHRMMVSIWPEPQLVRERLRGRSCPRSRHVTSNDLPRRVTSELMKRSRPVL